MGVVLLLVVAGGTCATYLWDEDRMPLAARLAAGAALGLAVFGLTGFGLALLLGLKPITIALATAVAGSPLVFVTSRARLQADGRAALRDIRARPGSALLLLAMAAALLVVFEGAVYFEPEGMVTSDQHNIGDLPFHVGIVTGFLRGDNYPPDHPELSGVHLSYPFLVDFIAAMLMRTGASLRGAFLAQNSLLVLSLLGLLYHWGARLTRDRQAALLVPPLVLLNGGLGFWMFFHEAYHSERGILDQLLHLTHNFTVLDPREPLSAAGVLRWGNSVTTLLFTQRAFLMGLPLALLAWTLIWEAVEAGAGGDEPTARLRSRRLLAAGIVLGLLPLAHTHTFAVMMAASCCWVILFPFSVGRAWPRLASALLVAAPALACLFLGSGMAARAFLGWHLGWDHGDDNVFWFWIYNTGLVFPALLAALAWRGRAPVVPSRLAFFLLPFAGCFILPNLLRLAPWIWDNVKFLFYWYLASTPLLALLLVRLWRCRLGWTKPVAVLAGLSLTLAGALDVWRVVMRQSAQRIFDPPGMAFAHVVMESTPPRAIILRDPAYNHPVLLTGRRSYLGYTGHLFSQGLDPGHREQDQDELYRGLPGSIDRARSAGVGYVVVGPMERSTYRVNEDALSSLPLVGEMNGFRLYRIPAR